jgi:hypothetical protein
MRRLPVLLALSFLLGACSVRITTKPVAEANMVCRLGGVGGFLAADDRTGMGIRMGADVLPVIWPFGWSARRDLLGPLILVDRDGRDVAREGDQVALGGGFDRDDVLHACDEPYLRVIEPGAAAALATYA